MTETQRLILEYQQAIYRLCQTGEPIWMDTREEAFILATHILQMGVNVKIMYQSGLCCTIEKVEAKAKEDYSVTLSTSSLNNHLKTKRIKG